jgi:hypothetical protein
VGQSADLGNANCADGEQEFPGLEDEVHGGPDADVGTSITSGSKAVCQAPERADGQGAASPVRMGDCSWAE